MTVDRARTFMKTSQRPLAPPHLLLEALAGHERCSRDRASGGSPLAVAMTPTTSASDKHDISNSRYLDASAASTDDELENTGHVRPNARTRAAGRLSATYAPGKPRLINRAGKAGSARDRPAISGVHLRVQHRIDDLALNTSNFLTRVDCRCRRLTAGEQRQNWRTANPAAARRPRCADHRSRARTADREQPA